MTKARDAKTCAHASLQSYLHALHAAGKLQEGMLRDLLEMVCKSYSELMRTHTAIYCNRLNSLSFDV